MPDGTSDPGPTDVSVNEHNEVRWVHRATGRLLAKAYWGGPGIRIVNVHPAQLDAVGADGFSVHADTAVAMVSANKQRRHSAASASPGSALEPSRSAAGAVADGTGDACTQFRAALEATGRCTGCEREGEHPRRRQSHKQGDDCANERGGDAEASTNPRDEPPAPVRSALQATVNGGGDHAEDEEPHSGESEGPRQHEAHQHSGYVRSPRLAPS
ncbi:MAG: hypothetical protein F4W98_14230 [Acidimicrobiales bacterium]|nr:hypothetical protein [Acidimicrobiales bacterium]